MARQITQRNGCRVYDIGEAEGIRWLAGTVLTLAAVLLAQNPLVAVLALVLASTGAVVGLARAWLMPSLLLVVGVFAYRQAVGFGPVAR